MQHDEDHLEAVREAEHHNFNSRFSPITLSDVTSGRLQPPPWLLGPSGASKDDEGLLRSQTITMLSAEPFTGKTMVMLATTLGLLTGAPTLGYSPAPGHRVLFLGQDAPTWDYYGSIRKLWLGLGSPPIPEDRALFFLNRGWRLTSPAFSNFVAECVSLFGTTVLMLDTLLAFHSADENSNKEMAEVMDLLKSWRDKHRLTIIFSHHTSKPSASGGPISGNYRARGASVIAGSVDFHLQLTPKSGLIHMAIPKRRGSNTPATAADHFAMTDHPSGGLSLASRIPTTSISRRLLDFLSTPHTLDECSAFILEHFPNSSQASVEGRLNGALGFIRRHARLTTHPDGRLSAVAKGAPK